MSAARTPGPWKVDAGFLVAPTAPGNPKGSHYPLYDLQRIVGSAEADAADRAFIVRSVNAHETLISALDHPVLRDLFASIEDSGTPEAQRLFCLCMQWFDVRDAALSAAQDSNV